MKIKAKLTRSEIDDAVLEASIKIGKSEEVGASNCPIKCPLLGLSRTRLKNELEKLQYTVKVPPNSDYIVILND